MFPIGTEDLWLGSCAAKRNQTKLQRALAAQQYDCEAACMTEPLDCEREAAAAEHSGPLLSRQPEHHLVNRIVCALGNMSSQEHTQTHMFADRFPFLLLIGGSLQLTLPIEHCCLFTALYCSAFNICCPACQHQHQHDQAYKKTSRGSIGTHVFILIAKTPAMINTCCVLTNWQVFIIMSWRLRAVINAAETAYETQRCGSATAATIIPIMANLYLSLPVDIMKLYFQEIELPIQGQMSFIASTCGAPTHASVRVELMNFYRDTQQRIWKQVLSICKSHTKSRNVQHTAKGVTRATSTISCL